MKYHLVADFFLADLEAQVNALIGEGWQPLGGPVSSGSLIQAMVKPEPIYVEPTIEPGPHNDP